MSRYCEVKTQFKDADSLIQALMETGMWSKEQIEVSDAGQHLVGFQGDIRQEIAHIIIRRKHISSASNDMGFRKEEDGRFAAIVSDFDKKKYDAKWMGQLRGNYGVQVLQKLHRSRGRTISREKLPGGRQRLIIGGYR